MQFVLRVPKKAMGPLYLSYRPGGEELADWGRCPAQFHAEATVASGTPGSRWLSSWALFAVKVGQSAQSPGLSLAGL